jgi:predicted ATPase
VWLAYGKVLRGWIHGQRGARRQAWEELQQGIKEWEATGAEVTRTGFLALLGHAYARIGQGDDAQKTVDDALHLALQNEEFYGITELWRLKGELALRQFNVQSSQFKVDDPQSAIGLPPPSGGNPQSEAEACFQKAIEIAQRQQAKSLELRATMSLARLWQQQGKQREAHQLLSKIYGWFTEGFDTKDLQEAKALFGELAEEA